MFELPPLPYAYDALSPVISEKTMRVHHDKHHAGYVKTLNSLVEASGRRYASLEDVVADNTSKKLFNNAAQAWNHAFFWESMSPKRGAPAPALGQAIDAAFGSLDKLKAAFVTAGVDQFGSGWVWLVADKDGALKVVATHDAEDVLTEPGVTPLLVCDLWEHAYYLDYQNERKGFLEAWFDALPNWPFAARQWAAAKGDGGPWSYPAPTSERQAA